MLKGLSEEWESEDEAGRQPGTEESRETISDSERLSAPWPWENVSWIESFFDGDYLVVQFEIDEFQKHAGRFAGDFEGELIRPLLGLRLRFRVSLPGACWGRSRPPAICDALPDLRWRPVPGQCGLHMQAAVQCLE